MISFKFKSERTFDTVKFAGDAISCSDLRRQIEEKRIRKREVEVGKRWESYELLLCEEHTNKRFTNDSEMIPTNSRIIVERVPQNATDYLSNFKSKKEEETFIPDASETKPQTSAGLYMAKSSNSGVIKRHDDKLGMMQMMQPISKSGAVYIPNSSSQYQIVYDPSLEPNEELEKKYTVREIEDMLSEARYFIIKSSNQDNINISRSKGEWATTVSNEKTLREAFQTSKNVILIFSVNRTSHYQGFARMCSGTGKNNSNIWRNTETIKLAPNFKVEWITYAALSINRFGSMTNPMNNNEPIKKSRDTQELPQNLGKEICLKFEIPLKEEKIIENDLEANEHDDDWMINDPTEFWSSKPSHAQDEGGKKGESDAQKRVGQAKKRKYSNAGNGQEEWGGKGGKESKEERVAVETGASSGKLGLSRKKSSEAFKPTGNKDRPHNERKRSSDRQQSSGQGRRRSRSKSKERHRERDRHAGRNERSKSRDRNRHNRDKLDKKNKHRRD